MAATETNSADLSSTVHATNWVSLVDINPAGEVYVFVIDLINLSLNTSSAADEFWIKIEIETRDGGAQRIVYENKWFGPQSPPIAMSVPVTAAHAIQVFYKHSAGSSKTIPWSLVKLA